MEKFEIQSFRATSQVPPLQKGSIPEFTRRDDDVVLRFLHPKANSIYEVELFGTDAQLKGMYAAPVDDTVSFFSGRAILCIVRFKRRAYLYETITDEHVGHSAWIKQTWIPTFTPLDLCKVFASTTCVGSYSERKLLVRNLYDECISMYVTEGAGETVSLVSIPGGLKHDIYCFKVSTPLFSGNVASVCQAKSKLSKQVCGPANYFKIFIDLGEKILLVSVSGYLSKGTSMVHCELLEREDYVPDEHITMYVEGERRVVDLPNV